MVNEDASTKHHWKDEIFEAQAFIEGHLRDALRAGHVVTTSDYPAAANTSKDWHLAIGNYRYWVGINRIKCNNGQLSMHFGFFIRDYYHFRVGSKKPAGLVTDGEMALLHLHGWGREFPVLGTGFWTVSWKRGQTSVKTITPDQ